VIAGDATGPGAVGAAWRDRRWLLHALRRRKIQFPLACQVALAARWAAGIRVLRIFAATKTIFTLVFLSKRSPSVTMRLRPFRFQSSRGFPPRQTFPQAKVSAHGELLRDLALHRSTFLPRVRYPSAPHCRPNRTRISLRLPSAAGEEGARSRKRSVRSEGVAPGHCLFPVPAHFRSTNTGIFLAAISGATS